MFLFDEEVSIPAEAIQYIEDKTRLRECQVLLKFEVIELFFEWFTLQSKQTQKEVLSKVMRNGRSSTGFTVCLRGEMR